MFMSKDKFFDKIKFNKDFPPFKKSEKNDEIKFWWQKEIQDLISFYKNDEVAKRFKINCILANNWGWKSRFFEIFKKHFIDDSIIFLDENDKEIFKRSDDLEVKSITKSDYEIILDDFFVLSKNKDYSINKDLLELWYNNFYCNVFNFLQKNKNIIDMFSIFLKENLSQKDSFSINISFPKEKKEILSHDTIKILLQYKWDDIWRQEYIDFIENIFYYEWIGWTGDSDEFPIFDSFIEKNKKFHYIYFFVSWMLKDIFEKIMYKNLKTYYFKYAYNIISQKNKDETLEEINDIFETCDKHKFQILLQKMYNFWKENDFSIDYYNGDYIFNNIKEIDFLSKNFDIQLRLWSKNFGDLSWWEKCMLARFTNIYMEIINSGKSDFIILIDEPDLHLHLDWQRQYIQKLIDVFSTINKDIKMHFILATHSPFIVSDLPSKSIILLQNWKQVNYDWKTFWANYIDLIRDWFFFEKKVLMWSFAEKIIWNIGKNELEAVMNWKEDFEWKELKENIWDEFLKDNLLYFKIGKDD